MLLDVQKDVGLVRCCFDGERREGRKTHPRVRYADVKTDRSIYLFTFFSLCNQPFQRNQAVKAASDSTRFTPPKVSLKGRLQPAFNPWRDVIPHGGFRKSAVPSSFPCSSPVMQEDRGFHKNSPSSDHESSMYSPACVCETKRWLRQCQNSNKVP